MCDHKNDNNNNNNSSLFIMGLIVGALIASAIILVSADDKKKMIKKIKDKFANLFDEKIAKPKIIVKKTIIKKQPEVVKKISVDIPFDVETLNLTPVKSPKFKKVFKKSK